MLRPLESYPASATGSAKSQIYCRVAGVSHGKTSAGGGVVNTSALINSCSLSLLTCLKNEVSQGVRPDSEDILLPVNTLILLFKKLQWTNLMGPCAASMLINTLSPRRLLSEEPPLALVPPAPLSVNGT